MSQKPHPVLRPHLAVITAQVVFKSEMTAQIRSLDSSLCLSLFLTSPFPPVGFCFHGLHLLFLDISCFSYVVNQLSPFGYSGSEPAWKCVRKLTAFIANTWCVICNIWEDPSISAYTWERRISSTE